MPLWTAYMISLRHLLFCSYYISFYFCDSIFCLNLVSKCNLSGLELHCLMCDHNQTVSVGYCSFVIVCFAVFLMFAIVVWLDFFFLYVSCYLIALLLHGAVHLECQWARRAINNINKYYTCVQRLQQRLKGSFRHLRTLIFSEFERGLPAPS